MSEILNKELNKLEISVLKLTSKVENNLRASINCLNSKDIDLAKNIIQSDKEIDAMEISIEEECLKILALHQPVAIDLRYIVAILKINNDLERIGDLSAHIAKITLLNNDINFNLPNQIIEMTEIVIQMLKDSLDSIIYRDSNLVKKVIDADDLVDQIHINMYGLVSSSIDDQGNSKIFLPILSVSRYLERIADHCTNIVEDVEYLITGKIARHNEEN